MELRVNPISADHELILLVVFRCPLNEKLREEIDLSSLFRKDQIETQTLYEQQTCFSTYVMYLWPYPERLKLFPPFLPENYRINSYSLQ
jgi:hypothetical protein